MDRPGVHVPIAPTDDYGEGLSFTSNRTDSNAGLTEQNGSENSLPCDAKIAPPPPMNDETWQALLAAAAAFAATSPWDYVHDSDLVGFD